MEDKGYAPKVLVKSSGNKSNDEGLDGRVKGKKLGYCEKGALLVQRIGGFKKIRIHKEARRDFLGLCH